MLTTGALSAILIAVAVVAAGSGYLISSWRTGAEIEKLRGKSEMLQTANSECVEDIGSVRDAMKQIEIVTNARARKAEDAMKNAQSAAQTHKARVVQIRSMPVVKPEAQCLAIEREQAAYVASRLEEMK